MKMRNMLMSATAMCRWTDSSGCKVMTSVQLPEKLTVTSGGTDVSVVDTFRQLEQTLQPRSTCWKVALPVCIHGYCITACN